jgi:hypothetical protein
MAERFMSSAQASRYTKLSVEEIEKLVVFGHLACVQSETGKVFDVVDVQRAMRDLKRTGPIISTEQPLRRQFPATFVEPIVENRIRELADDAELDDAARNDAPFDPSEILGEDCGACHC